MSSTSSPPAAGNGKKQRGSQTPRVGNWPPYAWSAAEEVIDLYEAFARPLDPWQKFVLRHGLGRTSAGEWAAMKVGCWVPRQNGKGGVIEALELAWLFLPGFQVPLVTHSAHQYRTAQEAFRRLKDVLEGSDELRPTIKAIRETNGEQGIELRTRQRLLFMARSRTGGRGFSAPRIVLDEGQELQDQMMASALPVMSAQPDPQIWFFGTPPDDPAAWCYGLREDGEAGTDDLAWFDWGASLDLDDPDQAALVADVDLWYQCNPALGGRIAEKFVRSELKPSGLGALFPYERLGVWRPRAIGGAGVVTGEQWAALGELAAEAVHPADVAFALDINPARTHAAILSVGIRPGGTALLSVVDYRPGTDWVAGRLAELRHRWKPVAFTLDKASPAASLLLDLDRVGIRPPADPSSPRRGDLIIPAAHEVAAAFGLLVDAIRQGTLRHLDEGPLNAALAGAGVRSLAGGQMWDRRGNVDICPLVAGTLAYWLHATYADRVTAPDYDLLQSFY